MKTKLIAAAISFTSLATLAAQGAPGTFMYVDGANGSRIIVPSTRERRGAQLWAEAVYSTPSGSVRVAETVSLPNPSGSQVATTARGTIPPAAVASAAGRVAAIAIKSLTPIAIGVAIYDVYKELNFTPKPDGTLTRTDPTACTRAPCYEYRLTTLEAWSPSYNSACYAYVARIGLLGQAFGVYSSVEGDGGHCKYYGTASRNPDIVGDRTGYNAQETAPSTSSQIPATLQDFIDAVAAKPSWPAGSKISSVMGQDPLPELQKPEGTTTSGPASTPGPVSRTVDTTNNTTNVQTTTHNHTYVGDTISTTTNITNITTNNTTGAVTNSTSTTTTPATIPGPTPEPVYKTTDTPLAPQPKLYEPVYPRGIAGVWTDKKDDLKSTPLNSLASSLMPNVGSGGSCPVMNVDLTFASWASFGVKDVAPPCYVWDWGKAIIILCSLLLARALIFGG